MDIDRWFGLFMNALSFIGMLWATYGRLRVNGTARFNSWFPEKTKRRRFVRAGAVGLTGVLGVALFIGVVDAALGWFVDEGRVPRGVITFEDKREPVDWNHGAEDSEIQYNVFAVQADGSNARQITFSADDGTPCSSSDGESLLFVQCAEDGTRSLWSMPAAGGDSEEVASYETERDLRRPACSPDGRYVAFETGDEARSQIWILDLDSSEVTILAAQDSEASNCFPAWSPDGKWFAYAEKTSAVSRIRLVDTKDWQVRRNLGAREGSEYTWPAFSSDSQRVGCAITEGGDTSIYIGSPFGSGGGWPGEYLASESADVSAPRWSPDGKWLAYLARDSGRPWHLVLRDLKTNETYRVTSASSGPGTWSPDSSCLSYSTLSDGRMRLQRLLVAEWEYEDLTIAPGGRAEPSVTRNGAVMATSVSNWNSVREAREFAIRIQSTMSDVTLDAAHLDVTMGNWPQPAVSPDGKRVAFIAAAKGKYQGELWVADAVEDGASWRVAGSHKQVESPAWFPSGDRLAIETQRHLSQVAVIDVEKRLAKPKILSDGTANDKYPAVSPNGRWIVFVSDRDEEENAAGDVLRKVYVMSSNGWFKYRLEDSGSDYSYGPACWSPDGTAIAITAHRKEGTEWRTEIHVWTLDSSLPTLFSPRVRDRYSVGKGDSPCWTNQNVVGEGRQLEEVAITPR